MECRWLVAASSRCLLDGTQHPLSVWVVGLKLQRYLPLLSCFDSVSGFPVSVSQPIMELS